MEEMLIINPRPGRNSKGRFVKRARRHNSRRRRVSARKRRRNPIAAVALANPRRRRRRNPIAAVALANPRRRRRHRAVGYTVGSRRIRRRKMNPRHMGSAIAAFKPRAILNSLIPAGIGALGAIGLDLVMAKIPLPIQFQTPLWKNVAKVIGAIGLGYVAGMAVGREKGKAVTAGALTIVAYGALKEVIASNFPSLGLSGTDTYDMSDLRLGYINPAPMLTGRGMGAYMNSAPPPVGVGAYMRGGLDNVNSLSGVTGDGL